MFYCNSYWKRYLVLEKAESSPLKRACVLSLCCGVKQCWIPDLVAETSRLEVHSLKKIPPLASQVSVDCNRVSILKTRKYPIIYIIIFVDVYICSTVCAQPSSPIELSYEKRPEGKMKFIKLS